MNKKLMSEKIHSICLSIRHDYDLLPEISREQIRLDVFHVIHAITKELPWPE